MAVPAVTVASAQSPSLSLEFIANHGQWNPRVRYEAALPAGQLFAEATAFTYALYDPTVLQHHGASHERPAAAGDHGPKPPVAAHAYTVHFEHANPAAQLRAESPTTEVRNYFIGSDERRWARNVPSFRRLRYAELWPGVELTLYENQEQQLEYDLLLAPRADPARIALRYDGLVPRLDAAGCLVLATCVGTVTELAPKAWQTDAQGRRQPVACRYVLNGTTVTFALGTYNHKRALIIDPVVRFSTLTGSTAANWGFTATYDNAGNLYSGGIVFNTGGVFPATPGAFQVNFSSLLDMALIKYNTSVSGPAARAWATYLGGNSSDFPHSLVVNGDNELVVLGSTSSNNFPTSAAALRRSFAGGSYLDPYRDGAPYDMPFGADLVVTRLSAAGNALQASTYLGGAGNDGVQALVVNGNSVPPNQLVRNYGDNFRGDVLLDGAGNVLVASNTASADFPGAVGAQGGASGAVVCKLTPDLNAVLWAWVLDGNEADAAYSLQLDAQQRVYVSGGTTSTDFPTTAGAYRPAAPGGVDGFVARIAANGTSVERATYVGTAGYDQSYFVQLDAGGNAYLLGQTLGNFPVTPGLYHAPGSHQFVQKFNPNLTVSLYSTVFGKANSSTVDLVPTAFLVDDCERVYVCGWGGSANESGTSGNTPYYLGGNTMGLPTPGGLQTATDGSDFYLAQFAPGMQGLDYATYFGTLGGVTGEHVDGGTSRFDKRGVVYQAVCAACGLGLGFPVPPGANTYAPTKGRQAADCNNGAFKLDFEVPRADPGPRRFVCAGGPAVPLGGTPAGGTWSGPGVQAIGNGFLFVPSAAGPGQYVLSYTVSTTGTCVSTTRVRYLVAPPVQPSPTPVPPQCVTGEPVVLAATPGGGVFSGPGVSGGRFDPRAAGAGLHTLTYTVTDSLGCGTATQRVEVTLQPVVAAGRDTTLCADQVQPFQLRGFGPIGGTWAGPGVTAGGFFTPPNTNNRGGVFALTYTVRQPPCENSATRVVVLAPANAQDVHLNLPVCAAAPQYAGLAPFDIPFTPILLAPDATYLWDFGDGSPASTEATPTHRYVKPGSYRVRLTARYSGCEVITQFAPLEVGEVVVPNIITPNRDQLNDTFQPRFSCQPASLKVFSRWGQQVYQTDHYTNDWRAEGLAAGMYYYLLSDTTGRSMKGWVEVAK